MSVILYETTHQKTAMHLDCDVLSRIAPIQSKGYFLKS
jgi:hypothetical protein